ncbi:HD domain-containing protein [Candidatus Woesearchaeota archaeon]|jgi:uncharacterized protein|nr:HD domain-containing protein [Candidatus Woesearchaeota archaeon]
MNEKLKEKLILEARQRISCDDPSHDFFHALRVLKNVELISEVEGGDMEVLLPAALFHDVINYPKDDARSKLSAEHSANVSKIILEELSMYPKEKIKLVVRAISEHSFSKGIKSDLKESQILQDADRLECAGAIAIMRTFCSGGQMKKKFYDCIDPFCAGREPDPMRYAIDLFYARLLKTINILNTKTAVDLAEKRVMFLHTFLFQLEDELRESGFIGLDSVV